MKWPVVVFVLSVAAMVTSREARWFFSHTTVTRYVYPQRTPTASSCVVVEESLKPCRHLRQMDATPTSVPPKIMMTATPRLGDRVASPVVLSSSQGEDVRSWGSYLGLTVTHTVTQLLTPKTLSPAAVVTFSVRGCQPSRLPFNLPLCSISNNSTASTNTPHIKDVHFVEE